jgi:hypothetical protein
MGEYMKNFDKFYTKSHIAKSCIEKITDNYDLWIEPSAGDGSFYSLLPCNKIGIDIMPENSNLIKHDFLTWFPINSGNFITIGNPPFGKNSSLAVKFFNHAATFSNTIAFIVPRTFEKTSVQNRLDKSFHLVYNEVLPQDSFLFNNENYSVPTVYQIWNKKSYFRETIKLPTTHYDFNFVNKDDADFSIQRVGVNAGKIKIDFENLSSESHYFIKSNVGKNLIEVMKSIDFGTVKYKTAGNPSISKSELVALYQSEKNKSKA